MRDLGSKGTPFDEETLELIIEGLGDLPPIVVVGRGSEVLDSEGTVIDNGAVIQLGPMISAGERFTVLALFYVGRDGAATVEYLIDEGVTGWEVAGATGTTTVS